MSVTQYEVFDERNFDDVADAVGRRRGEGLDAFEKAPDFIFLSSLDQLDEEVP
jgi:hypothetical protein